MERLVYHDFTPNSLGPRAHWTGAQTNTPEKVELRKMTLQVYVRNAKIFNSYQLKPNEHFSLSYLRWGLVGAGCILALPEGSERNHMFPLCEV